MTETAGATKFCTKCGEAKDAEAGFALYGGIKKAGRRRSACKACMSKASAAQKQRRKTTILTEPRMCRVCGETKEPECFEASRHQCKACRYEIERKRLEDKRAKGNGGRQVMPRPPVHKPLPLPRASSTTKGDIRNTPAPPPVVPVFRKMSTYGIEQFWAECPEAHKEWYAVLREEGIPASSPLYAHPCHDKYVPGKVTPKEV